VCLSRPSQHDTVQMHGPIFESFAQALCVAPGYKIKQRARATRIMPGGKWRLGVNIGSSGRPQLGETMTLCTIDQAVLASQKAGNDWQAARSHR
jgi:hypothetical protein